MSTSDILIDVPPAQEIVINWVETPSATPRARIAAERISTKPPLKDSDGCARCGCSFYDHKRDARGPCLFCSNESCPRFLTYEQLAYAKFFDFLKWAKNWIKAHKNRKPKQLRQIWDRIGNNLSFCTYCAHCKTATVMNNQASRQIVKRQEGLLCDSCKRCVSCCDCPQCDRCKKRQQAQFLCAACKKCVKNCCHCRQCRNCKKTSTDDHCEHCRNCNSCCGCGDQGRVPYYTMWNRKPKFHTSTLRQHEHNPTSRYISAEIEVAGIKGVGRPIYQIAKKWEAAVVYDGSLPERGFEICTAPAGGDLYVNQVREYCDEIRKQAGFINAQCGLHVHVDARDLDYYHIRRLVRIYASIEPALFGMVPPERQESRFCYPCGQRYLASIEEGRLPYDKVKNDVITSIYNTKGSTQDLRHSKYNQARYNALNLHAWFYYGTVESRMFNGTIDSDEIINWGVLWAKILDYTKEHTDEEVYDKMKDNTVACLMKIVDGDKKMTDFVMARLTRFGPAELKEELEEWKSKQQTDKQPQ